MQKDQVVPLTEMDLDDDYKLEALPDDFECPLCFMVKAEIFECEKCSSGACKECLSDFTSRSGKGNVSQHIFECTICHAVAKMNPLNRIMTDILLNMRFICSGPCA
jgi:hypothetical protein